MKLKHIQGIYLCLFLLSSIIIGSCATKEMESIEPFQYVFKDFDGVGELPELPAEQEPEEVVLDNGMWEIPESTLAEISLLEGLQLGQNLSPEMEAMLKGFSQVDVNNPGLFSIDASMIQAILDAQGGPISGDYQALFDKVANIPELAALLPKLVRPKVNGVEVTEGMAEGARISLVEKPVTVGLIPDANARISDLSTPCAEAAEAAYQAALNRLNMQRDAQEAQVESRYQERIAAFAALRDAQLAIFHGLFNGYRTMIFNSTIILLNASQIIRAGGQPELANFLVIYAISFAIQASIQLGQMSVLMNIAINYVYAMNVANADAIRQNSLNLIAMNYEVALARLQAIRDQVLDNCHNQGSID